MTTLAPEARSRLGGIRVASLDPDTSTSQRQHGKLRNKFSAPSYLGARPQLPTKSRSLTKNRGKYNSRTHTTTGHRCIQSIKLIRQGNRGANRVAAVAQPGAYVSAKSRALTKARKVAADDDFSLNGTKPRQKRSAKRANTEGGPLFTYGP